MSTGRWKQQDFFNKITEDVSKILKLNNQNQDLYGKLFHLTRYLHEIKLELLSNMNNNEEIVQIRSLYQIADIFGEGTKYFLEIVTSQTSECIKKYLRKVLLFFLR